MPGLSRRPVGNRRRMSPPGGRTVATPDDVTVAALPPPSGDATMHDPTAVAPVATGHPEVDYPDDAPRSLASVVIVFLVAFAVFVAGWILLGDVIDPSPTVDTPLAPPTTVAVATVPPTSAVPTTAPKPTSRDDHKKGKGQDDT